MGLLTWIKSFGTCNPTDLFAMAITHTNMQSVELPKDEKIADYLLRQIRDYDGMGKRARCKYIVCRWAQIIAGGLVSLFAGLSAAGGPEFDWARIAVGVLGVVVVIANGIEYVGQYYDKWHRWRRTWQRLILARQDFMFSTGSIGDEEKLASRLKKILGDEFNLWDKSARQHRKPSGAESPKEAK